MGKELGKTPEQRGLGVITKPSAKAQLPEGNVGDF